MYDEVEVDGLLPVDVGVADGQLAAVAPEHLHRELPGPPARQVLADEEEEVVAVHLVLRLEEEVPHEEVRPVRRVVVHREAATHHDLTVAHPLPIQSRGEIFNGS